MLESRNYTIKCTNEITNGIIKIEFIENNKEIKTEIKVKELLKYVVWDVINKEDFLPTRAKSK